MKSYKKIGQKHVDYARMLACKTANIPFCDAVTHNSLKGCKNPNCWKYRKT